MADVNTLPATDADYLEVAIRMRDADIREVRACLDKGPLGAIQHSVGLSKEVWATRIDGDLVCVWGVASAAEESKALGLRLGVIWMLTTMAVEDHKKAFAKACIEELRQVFDRWDHLFNAVDVRYQRAIKWGKRLGFRFQDPAPYGAHGLDFQAFSVCKEDLKCAQ